MNTISLEIAKTISEKHKSSGKLDNTSKDYNDNQLSDIESCAKLLIAFARERKRSAYGAQVNSFKGDQFTLAKGDEFFEFEELTYLKSALNCESNNCHQNCIAASISGLPGHTIVHTSEVSIIQSREPEDIGAIHSYVQLGDFVFDLDLGIRMKKPLYDKLFNVKELSTVESSKIRTDNNSGTLSQIRSQNISYEAYLMSRDDCVRQFGEGK